jgi:hypothetical protein
MHKCKIKRGLPNKIFTQRKNLSAATAAARKMKKGRGKLAESP